MKYDCASQRLYELDKTVNVPIYCAASGLPCTTSRNNASVPLRVTNGIIILAVHVTPIFYTLYHCIHLYIFIYCM